MDADPKKGQQKLAPFGQRARPRGQGSLARQEAFLKQDFIYLFLEKGEGKEKDGKRNIDQLPLVCGPTRN